MATTKKLLQIKKCRQNFDPSTRIMMQMNRASFSHWRVLKKPDLFLPSATVWFCFLTILCFSSDGSCLWKYCNIEEEYCWEFTTLYFEHVLLKRQEKKKETIPKIGITFVRDLCLEAVFLLYPEIRETALKPEVQFEICGNTMKFSVSPSKVCSASPVIITFGGVGCGVWPETVLKIEWKSQGGEKG